MFEEVVLGFSGQGGSEGEGPGFHRCGGTHGVEMTVEDSKKSGWFAGGFGEAYFAQVQVAVIECKRELGCDGGALGGTKACAESVEPPAQKEQERFQRLKRVFEIACEREVPGGAVKGEEAMISAV